MTKEENNQIDYLKKIFIKVLGSLKCSKACAQIAMAELLVYTFSENAKNTQDLLAKMNEWHTQVIIETVHALGPGYIKFFQALDELEKNQPGTINAMAALGQAATSDVVVRFVSPEELQNMSGDVIPNGEPPISPTKH